MKQATCKRCCGKIIGFVLTMLVVFSFAPLYNVHANNENDYAVWQIMSAVGEVNPSGVVSAGTPYVDVRIQLVKTTPFGNGTVQLVINTDETVLVNPRRSPRVDRSSLTAEQQATYDMLVGMGQPPSVISATFSVAQGTNAQLHDMEFGSLMTGPPGWDPGQLAVRIEPSDSTRGAWDGYGLFVDVRFDIIATAPTVTPITFDLYVGGHAGTWVPGHPGTVERPRPGPGPNGDFGDPPNRRDRQINGEVTIVPAGATSRVVNFSANGGTLAASGGSRVVNNGESLGTAMPANPTHAGGHVFDGWNTEQDGTGDEFTSAIPVNDNITVFAQWLAPGATPTRTVTFNGNGGDLVAGGGSRTVNLGSSIGLTQMPADPPIRADGHTFAGWTMNQDGTGGAFTHSTPVNSNITVFAQWNAPQQRTVTFDGNGGVIEANNTSRQVNDGLAIGNANMPTNPAERTTGHTFAGWNRNADGTGDTFTGETVVSGGNITVYAQWNDPVMRTVTFDGNGGDIAANNVSRQVINGRAIGANYMPPNPANRSDGFIFARWTMNADGSGGEFTNATFVTSDITVYAQWNPPGTYTVTFNGNGGILVTGGASRQVTSGQTVGSNMPDNPNRLNFTFIGWQTAAGVDFTAETVVSANVTVFAQWHPVTGGGTPQNRTVTFDANGGDLAANGASRTVVAGQAIGNAEMPGDPTRAGYDFTGWQTAGGISFTADTFVPVNITVYAQWVVSGTVVVTHTVTFDGNNGSPATQSRTVNAGQILGANNMPVVTRDGYNFAGWTMNQNGTGGAFTGATPVNDDITVYAQWTEVVVPVTFTVTFNANGGVLGANSEPRIVNAGEAIGNANMPSPPTRAGHTFAGWAMPNGDAFTGTTLVNGNIAVNARWNQTGGTGGPGGGDGSAPFSPRPQPTIPPTGEQAPPNLVDPDVAYEQLIRRNFVNGFPNGTFQPDGHMTRAEMMQVFFNISAPGSAALSGLTTRFTDVRTDDWHFRAIAYFERRGILEGFPDGTFRPNEVITNAEFAAMAVRFFSLGNIIEPDMLMEAEGHWGAVYVNLGFANGWFEYFGIAGTFRADAPITRAQAIALLNFYQGREPCVDAINNFVASTNRTVFSDLRRGHWSFYEVMEAAISRTYHINSLGNEIWQQALN